MLPGSSAQRQGNPRGDVSSESLAVASVART
jgi:hypothetical protein